MQKLFGPLSPAFYTSRFLLALLVFLGMNPLTAAASPLEGKWRTDCFSGFQKTEIFRGSTVSLVEENFSQKNCEKLGLRISSVGQFILDEAAGFIDFQFERVLLSVHNETYKNFYEQKSMCGIREWPLGLEQDITGLACDFFGQGKPVQVPIAGEARYGIYSLKGKQLFFGKLSPERDGRSPDRRPAVLDPRFFRLCEEESDFGHGCH